jgi:hypothetical protein
MTEQQYFEYCDAVEEAELRDQLCEHTVQRSNDFVRAVQRCDARIDWLLDYVRMYGHCGV